MKLNIIKKLTKDILTNRPETRASDDLLYLAVMERLGVDTEGTSAKDFFLYYRKASIPTLETIGRCRRKVQEEHEELKPTVDVQLQRKRCEKSFYDFSRGLC